MTYWFCGIYCKRLRKCKWENLILLMNYKNYDFYKQMRTKKLKIEYNTYYMGFCLCLYYDMICEAFQTYLKILHSNIINVYERKNLLPILQLTLAICTILHPDPKIRNAPFLNFLGVQNSPRINNYAGLF